MDQLEIKGETSLGPATSNGIHHLRVVNTNGINLFLDYDNII